MAAFDELMPPPAAAGTELTDAPLRAVPRAARTRIFDQQNGGFGGAPKFPQPQMLHAPAARLARERATPPSRTCRRSTWRP